MSHVGPSKCWMLISRGLVHRCMCVCVCVEDILLKPKYRFYSVFYDFNVFYYCCFICVLVYLCCVFLCCFGVKIKVNCTHESTFIAFYQAFAQRYFSRSRTIKSHERLVTFEETIYNNRYIHDLLIMTSRLVS